MYSGMTRNEVRGILALVLIAALGVGARTYLSDSPRRGVWVERPLKQSSALCAAPTPAPVAVVSPTPAPAPSTVVQAAQIVAPPISPPPALPSRPPTDTPLPTSQSLANQDTSQTVVIAPNLLNAQSVVIAPNAHSVTFSGTPQTSPATPAATPSAQPSTSSRGKAAASTLAGPINLNTATLADLDKLPGVGPKTAQKILDYRTKNGPFRSVDDLINVSGIGPKTLEKIRASVRVN